MLNSIYSRNEILSVAVADLSLPKIGLESLVLLGSTSMVFKADFLNRVGKFNVLHWICMSAKEGFFFVFRSA